MVKKNCISCWADTEAKKNGIFVGRAVKLKFMFTCSNGMASFIQSSCSDINVHLSLSHVQKKNDNHHIQHELRVI